MATPRASWNLHLLAQRLSPARRCFCAILGDSTCAQNQGGGGAGQARWAYGIIRRWAVEWAQYVGWDYSTASGEGNSSVFLPGTSIDPGGLLLDGVTTNPFAIGVVDQAQASAGSHDISMGRVFLNALDAYRSGDWTTGQTLLVRRLWTRGTGGNLNGCTQVSDAGIIAHNATLYGAAGARAAYDQTYTRSATPRTSVQLDILNHGAVSGTICNYKTMWRAQNSATGLGISRGFGWSSISQGGWTTRSHLDNYATAALTFEIDQCSLNTIFIQLGINVASGESSGNLPTATFTSNYSALLDKVHAAFDAAGSGAGVRDKLVVCMTPWECGGGGPYQTAQSDIVRNLAMAKHAAGHPTAFVSMDSQLRMALGENWFTAGGGSGAPYLADNTHQANLGATTMADLLWQESRRALAMNENRLRRRRLAA